jgi:RNA 2',3'-cyclic 3'-phosphodiesterase
LFKKSPHHVVCSEILNLQKQDGFRSHQSALAEAYRVMGEKCETPFKCVGAKPDELHRGHSRVNLFIPRFTKQVNNFRTVQVYNYLTSFQAVGILPKMKPQRLFIAIEFSREVIQSLDKVSQTYQHLGLKGVRWVNAKNMHLTLRFLGDTYPDRLEMIKTMLVEASAKQNPFDLAIEGCGAFPNLRTPRVIWVGIQAGVEMSHFQNEIENGCRNAGLKAEDRAFNPHLTLGRVSENASREDMARIGRAIQENQVGRVGQCTIDNLTLFKSDLTPEGPIYTPMGHYLLKSR